ncbi:diguanylate cyclase domain-containing protein [Desulfobacter hydrogenophilus]|nr:diguanylate cyclase [Desulfobacter hydrogenophilus]NDY74232.1 diguanylate cyclase [Desulfobacter hydrogenophilus]
MVLIIYSITSEILLGGYAKLEKENILLSMDQAIKIIDNELVHLQSIVGEWAACNDTYFFVQHKNQKYIDDNLMDSTLANLHVNFLLFINTAGEIVYCKYFNPETGRGETCPESIKKYLSFDGSFLLRNKSKKEALAGLAILPENPSFLASAPILTSQRKGPVMGTLIAGRYLNAPEIKRLASLLNLSVAFERLDGPSLSERFKKAKQSLTLENKVAIILLDKNTIGAYSLLTDLTGTPILMLGIDKERRIYFQGKSNMRYLIYSLLITGLVFIITTFIFLEITVLSRMIRLNSDVKEITSTGNLSAKTKTTGKDELSDLSTQINLILESVRVSTERDRAILESIEDAYFEVDLAGTITFHNDALSKIFNYDKEALGKVNYRQLLDESAAEKAFNTFQHLYKTGIPVSSMETEFELENGQKTYLESSVSLIKDNKGKTIGFRGISKNVTEQKKSSKRLLYMAYHDSLTGLLNRKAFHEDLEKELLYADRYKQQRVVMYLDLDKFKKVNDTFGHHAGDHLLKEFAQRVKKVLRDTDLVYRLGGDEFAIILTSPQDPTPDIIAQRILDVMVPPFYLKSQTIDFVTTSIGISFYPSDSTDAETLLQCADKAMYEAKKDRNKYVIFQDSKS